MTKFNFAIPAILMISLLTLAPLANAGCGCSAGTWDPSGFLNSDAGTGLPSQPIQSAQAEGSQESAAVSSSSTQ
ncbi:MAG TPA: hypothetical protein PK181_03550, partial [Methanothrix soehngenii]|nr:hypothetical protein [Methanothrix soehngenii]